MVVLYGWGDWVNLLQAMDKCIEQDWMFTNVNMEGSDAQWLAAWIWSSLTLASARAVVPPECKEWPPTSLPRVVRRCDITQYKSEHDLLMLTKALGVAEKVHLVAKYISPSR